MKHDFIPVIQELERTKHRHLVWLPFLVVALFFGLRYFTPVLDRPMQAQEVAVK